ncbi:MAG: citramalate synthase [Alphaproteobacteria bacterium]|nr:citramalate synthase [Alphaproteobacteria bacterium]
MQKTNRITLFDTTLRDGAQTQGIDFSLSDKLAIAHALDDFGMDYVEGGWPGANPTDEAFFANPPQLKKSIFTAFGMTRRAGRSMENDPSMTALFSAKAKAYCIFGKSWDFQVREALGISNDENLELIRDTFAEVKKRGSEGLFDAEHFFDGYKSDPAYAMACLKAAYSQGVRWVVLCDTNGGTLPNEVEAIVSKVVEEIPGDKLGIHAHNDTENAVANSLAAVRAGARMVQGTLNGLGERCGNANIISLIPTLKLKMGFDVGVDDKALTKLTRLSRDFDERLNRPANRHAAYVGENAFAHKGGVHASAVEKNPSCYEHLDPAIIGNERKIVVSDQSGRANVLARLRDFGIEVDAKDPRVMALVDTIKQREYEGYAYDGAEASFELIARRMLGKVPTYFEVLSYAVTDERRYNAKGVLATDSEASVKIKVGEQTFHTVADGNGPVNAIDRALRKALEPIYPKLSNIHLTDYRVRILHANDASGAMPRVWIETALIGKSEPHWATVGVSTNIIDASFDALGDSYYYYLLREHVAAAK